MIDLPDREDLADQVRVRRARRGPAAGQEECAAEDCLASCDASRTTSESEESPGLQQEGCLAAERGNRVAAIP